MRSGPHASRFAATLVTALLVAGCGGASVAADEPRDATACQRALHSRGVAFVVDPRTTQHPLGRPDLPCLVEDPLLLSPVIRKVSLRPRDLAAEPEPLYAACALALAMDDMAAGLAARGVTEVAHFGIYGCRVIAGTDLLSEHGRARALDIAALRTASGETYTVLTDWEKDRAAPVTAKGQFLREVVTWLFETRTFNVILTPDFNADHADHFHLDLTPELRLFR